MAVEEEVVVKAEEAPVSFKGSVRFEIKSQRAAPTRPALDCFRDLEDRVDGTPGGEANMADDPSGEANR